MALFERIRLTHGHFSALWPSSIEPGTEIAGLDLQLADAEIAGWVSRRTSLSDAEREELEDRCRRMEVVLPSIPADAQPYFERLARLGRLALGPRGAHRRKMWRG
ncbi:MAG: hypothetical protein FJW64_06825 [Actinobacteria bacterium]|nr:hypothetical protein [Actinomycetota bacterium]